MQQITDAAGRTAWLDPSSNKVFTEGGTNPTHYSLDAWNQRQLSKYGASGSGATGTYGASEKNQSSTPTYSSTSQPNIQATIDQALKAYQQAVQPAVQQYEASIPNIQQQFSTMQSQIQAEKEPLQARYDNLLNKIKGQQEVAENRQTVATSNELGRRGILSSSGLAEQEMARALNPITSDYTGLMTEAGLSQEADLRNLVNQMTNVGLQGVSAEDQARQNMANLLAGAGTQGVSSGINQYQFASQLGQQQSQFDQQQEMARKLFEQVTLPQLQYDLGKPYYAPKDSPSGGMDIEAFLKLLGNLGPTGGSSPSSPPSTTAPSYFTPSSTGAGSYGVSYLS